MFRPNLVGQMRPRIERDVHGRPTWGAKRPCPFAIVNFDLAAIKTSVRADSSASRGAADEMVAQRAVILVGTATPLKVGDQFTFEGSEFVVASVHKRRSVTGQVDHLQIGLEMVK